MANMYPDFLPKHITSDMRRRAEIEMYNALRAGLSDECDVYYSVAWHHRLNSSMDGEADFVVLDRRRGLMCIEVKGGRRIWRDSNEIWYQESHDGHINKLKRSPLEQARESRWALREKLADFMDVSLTDVRICHAAAFPGFDGPLPYMGPDANLSLFIYKSHMGNIGSRLDVIWDHFKENLDLGPMKQETADKVRKFISPSFELSAGWGGQLEEIDRHIDRLSDSQFLILDGLRRQRRAQISGGAGTGKTVLAIEKARRLGEQGMTVLLTCYNRPLADRMAKILDDVENVQVRTFHQLCWQLAEQAGIEKPEGGNFSVYPALLEQALDKLGPQYDAVIVDEGQDFGQGATAAAQSDWWTLLQLSLRDPGIFYVFLDQNQTIYADVDDLPGGLAPFDLTENLRNTSQIHSHARRLYSGSEFASAGPKGPQVTFYAFEEDDFIKCEKLIRGEIARLSETVELNDIVVLASNKTLPVFQKLPKDIKLESVKRFKGLDSRAVILVANGEFSDDPELAYVGSTRARSVLSVIGTKSDNAIIKNGLG
jgi:hypothetical protein